jgi:pimeloyl-ACP methyl ester carboxylesterase
MRLPSKATDPSFLNWQAMVQRAVSSPSAWEAYTRQGMEHDVRAVLPAIRVPTLVMHVRNNPFMLIELGRYIANHIEGARMIELEGADVAPYWEQPDEILSIQRLKSIGSLVRQNPGTKGVSLFQEGCERLNCDANCASSSVGGFCAC